MTRPGERTVLLVLALLTALAVTLADPFASFADHESDNVLSFEPVTGAPSPAGSGTGSVEFRGGADPESRWTISFQVAGLQPETDYVVVVKGRFGEDDSPEASAFSPICAFRTDGNGNGGCWYYLIGLRRLGVVQVRLGREHGPPVLQATRQADGPGSMESTTTFHSLALTATPLAERNERPASPVATP